jgi:hypothetical protein
MTRASRRPLDPMEIETKWGLAHADDLSECMEPVWCPREHVQTAQKRPAAAVVEDRDDAGLERVAHLLADEFGYGIVFDERENTEGEMYDAAYWRNLARKAATAFVGADAYGLAASAPKEQQA